MVVKIDYLDKMEFQKVEYPKNIHFLISGGGNGITPK